MVREFKCPIVAGLAAAVAGLFALTSTPASAAGYYHHVYHHHVYHHHVYYPGYYPHIYHGHYAYVAPRPYYLGPPPLLGALAADRTVARGSARTALLLLSLLLLAWPILVVREQGVTHSKSNFSDVLALAARATIPGPRRPRAEEATIPLQRVSFEDTWSEASVERRVAAALRATLPCSSCHSIYAGVSILGGVSLVSNEGTIASVMDFRLRPTDLDAIQGALRW